MPIVCVGFLFDSNFPKRLTLMVLKSYLLLCRWLKISKNESYICAYMWMYVYINTYICIYTIRYIWPCVCIHTHTCIYTDKCGSHPHLLPAKPPVDISSFRGPPRVGMQRPSNHVVYSPNWYIYLQHSPTAPKAQRTLQKKQKIVRVKGPRHLLWNGVLQMW